jgi:hypothetical protein
VYLKLVREILGVSQSYRIFCLAKNLRLSAKNKFYKIKINGELKNYKIKYNKIKYNKLIIVIISHNTCTSREKQQQQQQNTLFH